MIKKRKVCVVLVDRANYGRLKPVMQAIQDHPGLELQSICTGSMILERFGSAIDLVVKDGFPVDSKIYIELEGSVPTTMAKSVGFATIEFASEFRRLEPDIVLVVGDRYEALSATLAAAYQNICICHIQGGEVSGSIHESNRHAISKFAHFHFPATQRSAEYLTRMGERPDTILGVGCPGSDIAATLDRTLDNSVLNQHGRGADIDTAQPFLLVVFHPTTTEFGDESDQADNLLEALHELSMQTALLWPNIDAGSDHISKRVRQFRDRPDITWMRNLLNFAPEDYLKVLANASCAVGNSSSFVRDAGYFGTPVVLVGNRQEGREWDAHVEPVPPVAADIATSIRKQLAHGRYPASTLYGDGEVSPRIARALAELTPYTQKRLHYVSEGATPAP